MIEIYQKKGKVKTIPKTGKVWVNLVAPTREEVHQVGKAFKLHPLTIEDLEHRAPRIKIEYFPNYTLCVFRRVTKGGLRTIYHILGDKFCISVSKYGFEEIPPKILEGLLDKGPAWVFHYVFDKEVDKFVPYISQVEKEILALEKRAFVAENDIPKKVMALRARVSQLKTILVSQHERLAMLLKEENKHIPNQLIPYLRDVYDHALHQAAMVESLRENLRAVFETYQSTVTQNLNNVMKVLSIIATIMLPLTVVSGVWGTNFYNLPGKEDPYGFWIMLGFMALLCLGMMYYFKKKKWF